MGPVTTPVAFADLEIRILERQDDGYPVEITFSGNQQFPRGYLDPEIVSLGRRRQGLGEALFESLFAHDELKQAWAEARGQSSQRRVRMRIDETAPELHALPWEAMVDSGSGVAMNLAATADTPFSRYLAGKWRPGAPVLERPIRMLAAIADADDLTDYGLTPLDPAKERQALEQALAEVSGEQLELDFLTPPVTLASLETELKKGYHILHLVGHGKYNPAPQESILFLAGADNKVAPVTESDLAEMLARQGSSLRLVFLASCQSAKRSPADAFRGFAPRLIAAGVPAVLAMQDQVAVATARDFAASFYRRLLDQGLVDLAANEARSEIISAGLPGAAIPVLFMRLRGGRLFDRRGRIVSKEGDKFWSTLLENIADGECTPFLGPGVTEGLLPQPRELALDLAAEHGYPLSDSDRLPRVAQYVATWSRRKSLCKEVLRLLTAGFKRHMGLPAERHERADLSQTIADAGWSQLSLELCETEIHHQLADLDLPLYLTTNFDSFMTLALAARGREVRREALAWHQPPRHTCGSPYHDLDLPATPEQPVVMHLFGTDEVPESMVLSEDGYLDYLARIARDHEHLLATSVAEALAANTLVFLGYRLEDLDLKIILRGLLPPLNIDPEDCLQVAIQLADSEARERSHEEVVRYFQKYFDRAQIDVYWGSTHQFVADLHARWKEYRDG